jgi:hypothetical protein
MEKDYLVLKRASASRPSGEWNDDDYDVLADGAVVSRIFKARGNLYRSLPQGREAERAARLVGAVEHVLKRPWRTMKAEHFGGSGVALHASALSAPTQPQLDALVRFFREQEFCPPVKSRVEKALFTLRPRAVGAFCCWRAPKRTLLIRKLSAPVAFSGGERDYLSVVHLKRLAFFFAPPSNTARHAGLR